MRNGWCLHVVMKCRVWVVIDVLSAYGGTICSAYVWKTYNEGRRGCITRYQTSDIYSNIRYMPSDCIRYRTFDHRRPICKLLHRPRANMLAITPANVRYGTFDRQRPMCKRLHRPIHISLAPTFANIRYRPFDRERPIRKRLFRPIRNIYGVTSTNIRYRPPDSHRPI